MKEENYEYNFIEIFNLDEIQKLQDAFSAATGVASIITKIDGTPITRPSGFSCFCIDIVRNTEIGKKNCMYSDSIIGSPNNHGARMQRCLSAGLLDGGASINIGDKHIANWLIGQVLDEDDNIEDIIKYGDVIGVDKNTYKNALQKVNKMTKKQFSSICDFLFLNAEHLSKLAVENYKQKQEIKRRIIAEGNLAKEKELFRVTIASIGDAVITTDINGNITTLNEVAENLTGWKNKEAIGRPLENVFNIINEDTLEKCENPVSKVLSSGKIVMLANHTALISKDEKIISIADSGAPIKDSSGKIHGVVLVFRDVTEEKKKNDEISFLSYHDKLTGLYNRTYFEDSIKRFEKENSFPLSVIVGDVNNLKLTNDILGHEEGDKLLVTIGNIIKNCCEGKGIIARWGGDEFSIILPNTPYKVAEEICSDIREECLNNKDCIILPSIALGTSTKEDSSQNLSLIIKKAEDRMYRNKLLESKSKRSGIVTSLKRTLFEKSYETEEHALRLVELGQQIGAKLGLRENDMDDLKLLATLHDIGKIAISDNILTKPDKLSLEEWDEMKRHSEIGFRIIQSTLELSHISEYILCHHERWDGSGYPKGLSGESIPLLSRIISIVDSYDVMTNIRPYKGKMAKEDAIKEIRRCSGKQFDGEIADIFIDILLEKDK